MAKSEHHHDYNVALFAKLIVEESASLTRALLTIQRLRSNEGGVFRISPRSPPEFWDEIEARVTAHFKVAK